MMVVKLVIFNCHRMEPLNVSKEAVEDYCCEYDENEDGGGVFVRDHLPRRLIKGINLKDLCDGKEVTFELSKDFEKNLEEEDEEDKLDDVVHCDSKIQRENRGAPPLNYSFETMASKMVNITDDGLVKKQLVKNGTGECVPDNSYVTVHYNLYKENCEIPFDSTYLRGRPEKFRLDQGETILGLEIAIKTMKKNENSCFFIKWEVAFGEMGCPDRIEEKCDIVADITLVNFVELNCENEMNSLSMGEINKLDFNKSMTQAKQLHLNGCDDFAKGNFRSAIICYRKTLRILNSLRLANEEQESLMLKQKVKCLVNLAVCYNKLGKNEQCCLACQEVLSIDCNNVKAYFHYGRANIALSNFSLAHKLLSTANKLKPNDKDINNELRKLNEKKSLYEVKDKIFWQKAFKNENEQDDKSQGTPTSLETFEKNLRTSLEECLAEKKSYTFSGPLQEEEKNICNKIANAMDLRFESKEDSFVFQRKSLSAHQP